MSKSQHDHPIYSSVELEMDDSVPHLPGFVGDSTIEECQLLMGTDGEYGPRRKCIEEGCITILGQYNKGPKCNLHTDPIKWAYDRYVHNPSERKPYKKRSRRSKCPPTNLENATEIA